MFEEQPRSHPHPGPMPQEMEEGKSHDQSPVQSALEVQRQVCDPVRASEKLHLLLEKAVEKNLRSHFAFFRRMEAGGQRRVTPGYCSQKMKEIESFATAFGELQNYWEFFIGFEWKMVDPALNKDSPLHKNYISAAFVWFYLSNAHFPKVLLQIDLNKVDEWIYDSLNSIPELNVNFNRLVCLVQELYNFRLVDGEPKASFRKSLVFDGNPNEFYWIDQLPEYLRAIANKELLKKKNKKSKALTLEEKVLLLRLRNTMVEVYTESKSLMNTSQEEKNGNCSKKELNQSEEQTKNGETELFHTKNWNFSKVESMRKTPFSELIPEIQTLRKNNLEKIRKKLKILEERKKQLAVNENFFSTDPYLCESKIVS